MAGTQSPPIYIPPDPEQDGNNVPPPARPMTYNNPILVRPGQVPVETNKQNQGPASPPIYDPQHEPPPAVPPPPPPTTVKPPPGGMDWRNIKTKVIDAGRGTGVDKKSVPVNPGGVTRTQVSVDPGGIYQEEDTGDYLDWLGKKAPRKSYMPENLATGADTRALSTEWTTDTYELKDGPKGWGDFGSDFKGEYHEMDLGGSRNIGGPVPVNSDPSNPMTGGVAGGPVNTPQRSGVQPGQAPPNAPPNPKEGDSVVYNLSEFVFMNGKWVNTGAIADRPKSDKDSKKKVKETTEKAVLDFIRKSKGYTYEYKDPDSKGAAPGRHLSPMAQDMEKSELGKDSVIDDPETGTKMVDYQRNLGSMLAGMNIQQKKIDSLEATLKEVLKELKQLKGKG